MTIADSPFDSSRQLPMYSKPSPPALLASHIPDETYKKSQAYGRDRSRFGIFRQLVDQLSSWGMIVGGVYLWGWDKAGATLAKLGVDPARVVRRMQTHTHWHLIPLLDPSVVGLHRSTRSYFVYHLDPAIHVQHLCH